MLESQPSKDKILGPDELSRRLAPLLAGGQVARADLDLDETTLLALGFKVESGRVSVPEGIERLSAGLIQAELSDRARNWLKDLQVLDVVGSTNTLVSGFAGSDGVHGVVRLAELQVQGRGRRGRAWISPFAQNLALSIGIRIPVRPDGLGGFSLCAGLAVADRLQSLGVQGVELKWPNDVLVDGRKIAGILVELHSAGDSTDIVVGIGINFRLSQEARQEIDQPVVDLEELGDDISRNRMAAGIISSMVDFADGFSRTGFDPMRTAFNQLHRFQDQHCTLFLGEERLAGQVRGVTTGGELLLEVEGQIRSFNSGEVSLRGI